MDKLIRKDIEGLSGSQIEQNKETVSPIHKLAKGKIRWLLLIGIEPLEDESGNIIYRWGGSSDWDLIG